RALPRRARPDRSRAPLLFVAGAPTADRGALVRGAVLVVGASAGIGRAVARRLAAAGHPLVLAARDRDELEREAAHLRVCSGVPVTVRPWDARDPDDAAALWRDACAACGGEIEGLVLCHGDMAEQADAQRDPALARRMIEVNLVSVAALCEAAAATLEARSGGFVCALGSVAGDRGRASNYLYGATKAALEALLEGLRARLAGRGVAVVLVKPGPVDTAMTWGRPGPPIAAAPERV